MIDGTFWVYVAIFGAYSRTGSDPSRPRNGDSRSNDSDNIQVKVQRGPDGVGGHGTYLRGH